jgi:hypothetical protein
MTKTLASVAAATFLLFAACTAESKPADAPAQNAPAPAAAPSLSPITEETLAKLAKADAKDGSVDKVVHRCAGCSLGMDGEAKWPLQVQDYMMHFCKQACLDRYAKDPAKAIAAMKIKD